MIDRIALANPRFSSVRGMKDRMVTELMSVSSDLAPLIEPAAKGRRRQVGIKRPAKLVTIEQRHGMIEMLVERVVERERNLAERHFTSLELRRVFQMVLPVAESYRHQRRAQYSSTARSQI